MENSTNYVILMCSVISLVTKCVTFQISGSYKNKLILSRKIDISIKL